MISAGFDCWGGYHVQIMMTVLAKALRNVEN